VSRFTDIGIQSSFGVGRMADQLYRDCTRGFSEQVNPPHFGAVVINSIASFFWMLFVAYFRAAAWRRRDIHSRVK
jgi:hypothetical protein